MSSLPAHRRGTPRGFTLIEVIVAVAIMIMMAAVILPSVIRAMDRARVDDGRNELQKIVAGVTTFEADVNAYPRRLSYLLEAISNTDRDICGGTFSNGEVGKWAGPYFERLVPANGLPISIGVAQDSFPRTNISGGSSLLNIVVTNVSLADAIELNEIVDGDNSATQNTVRWTAGADPTTLIYMMPINGC